MLKGYLLQCFFVLCLFWRADGYTAEEDEQFEHFVRFALDLREKFFEAGGRQEKVFGSATLRQTRPKSRSSSRQRRQNRSGPGFYALPLPYLPQVKNKMLLLFKVLGCVVCIACQLDHNSTFCFEKCGSIKHSNQYHVWIAFQTLSQFLVARTSSTLGLYLSTWGLERMLT